MKFNENYIHLVVSIALSRASKNIPNAIVAARIGCNEWDIEEGRKNNHLVDFAFKETQTLLREKIWPCALSLLKTRACSIITYDSAGNIVSREEREVLTNRDDILCVKQLIDKFGEREGGVNNARLAMQKRK